MNTEDNIRVVFAGPLGFLFGVVLSGVVTFAALTEWYYLGVFLALCAAFFLRNSLSDKMSLRIMERLSDRSEAELKDLKDNKRVGNHSYWPHLVFFGGALLGYGATFIWSFTDILSLFS